MMGGLLPLRRILPALLVVWSLLVSIGCTVGPNYVEPKMEVPEKFSEVSQGEAAPEPVDLSRWWTIFNDPRLDGLIEQAIQSNKDLKVAEARVREARALRGVVAADAYPQITASGSYTRIRRSENQSPSASAFQAGNTGGNNEQDLFDAGFDASWEIDIFGGI
ncbi:MAG: TolC family protein, partial [Deltaproteobacteria bacterium]|nr:TolC family protein [Deltaproteobacteria bacterium]